MKNLTIKIAVLFLTISLFTSCELVGDIFKAGMGFGIFIVIAVIVLFLFLLSKLFGKK
ncbi:hypothetical protein [Flavobacterium sp. UMI-01]|uniref:hypothetical protein n=1 Tax=Flavobacterium sp. UMI-01 TaxID=1441053 RepID=UPI001C7D767B|nr:hypothetical protein [Flavobacterium sp. UMI-01]